MNNSLNFDDTLRNTYALLKKMQSENLNSRDLQNEIDENLLNLEQNFNNLNQLDRVVTVNLMKGCGEYFIVECGGINSYIKAEDEGVVVDLWDADDMDDEPLASTYSLYYS